MSKDVPNLFGNLSLKDWYKYLLYLSGILLIITLVFGSSFDQTTVINYSISIMGLSIFLWILEDIMKYIDNFIKPTSNFDSEYRDNVKVLIVFREIVHLISFFIWIFITFRAFF